MAENIDVKSTNWRLVEVGRVVIFSEGKLEGRLAAIVEIVDHKRVLVDGPSSVKDKLVVRTIAPLNKLSLTPHVIKGLPRGAGNGALRKLWESEEVEKKFEQSNWSQSRSRFAKRKQLNDFERFKVMKLRKQARFEVQKSLAQIRAKA
ncbi:60S ribosomal protein L14 [Lepidopterella palustris CBS 459.81]|uniref:60S ribosomal protein L14 n=1 Tax=Lepidopterella palustris CBS 459.81 TaxID=1314670 RepID=A0A8E2EDR0_9PEZI|nr:60S ribosomal protein L14 [Lepidopterella palustris CBS 459.81]